MGLDIRHVRRGSGEPIVLIHGIGHRRQAWDPVIPLLAEESEVIAIDLPGFGESALPEGRVRQPLGDQAEAVEGLDDRLV